MAHIVEFEILGLAGRKDPVQFKLNRDINVFFGANGVGKTSLLRILESALSQDADSIASVPFKSARVQIYSVSYGRTFTYTIEKPAPTTIQAPVQEIQLQPQQELMTTIRTGWIQAGQSYATRLFDKWHWTLKESDFTADVGGGWNHAWLPTSRLYLSPDVDMFPGSVGAYSTISESVLDSQFGKSLSRLWSSYSAQLLSNIRKAQEKGLTNILLAVINPPKPTSIESKESIPRERAYNLLSAFLNRMGESTALGTKEDFFARYNSQLASVSSDISSVEVEIEKAAAPRRRLEELVRQMFSGPKALKFSDTAIQVLSTEGQDIGLASLSSGEKHVLRIFAEALTVNESSLLIDEPEISLHVDWQRRLVASLVLLNPGCQLVVATHSPEVMAEIPDEKIFKI